MLIQREVRAVGAIIMMVLPKFRVHENTFNFWHTAARRASRFDLEATVIAQAQYTVAGESKSGDKQQAQRPGQDIANQFIHDLSILKRRILSSAYWTYNPNPADFVPTLIVCRPVGPILR